MAFAHSAHGVLAAQINLVPGQNPTPLAAFVVRAEDVLRQEQALGVPDNQCVPESEMSDVCLCNDVVGQLEVGLFPEGVSEIISLLAQDISAHCILPKRSEAQQVVRRSVEGRVHRV